MSEKPNNERILAELRGPSPPQSIEELAERLGLTYRNVAPRISLMIKAGKLASHECPWRAKKVDPATQVDPDSIIRALKAAVDEGGKDRVSAATALYSILTQRGQNKDEIVPQNNQEIVEALSRQMKAAGRPLTVRAYREAFNAPKDKNPDGQPPASSHNLGGHVLSPDGGSGATPSQTADDPDADSGLVDQPDPEVYEPSS